MSLIKFVILLLERLVGLEPATDAWRAPVLPLHHSRKGRVSLFVATQKQSRGKQIRENRILSLRLYYNKIFVICQWCGWGDLNPHELNVQRILSPMRLPIPPHPQISLEQALYRSCRTWLYIQYPLIHFLSCLLPVQVFS